jgi:hypothetical protein
MNNIISSKVPKINKAHLVRCKITKYFALYQMF